MNFSKTPLAIAITVASLSLIGCSSGGGGGSPDQGTHVPQPPTQPEQPEQPIEPPTKPELNLQTVTVGVADTGFDVSSLASPERVISTRNVINGGADVNSGDTWHGNVVTDTITETYPRNTNVRLYQVSAGNTTTSSALTYGLAQAASDGARVINASFANRMFSDSPSLTFNGETTQASYDKIVNSNDGKGAVYTMGAGNSGVALPATPGSNYDGALYDTQPDVWDMSLIVVGSTDNGNAIHPSSNYPGDNERFQERTIATDYVNPGVAQGTSIATARISAYAAGVIGMWPHLTAEQASNLLLDTADKSSPLYGQNSCGATGTMNCGFYYLGQGEADIDAALSPQGNVTVSVSERIDGERHAADATFIQLSSAYGDALAASGVLENVAVFDDLGRDYRMDFSGSAQQSRNFNRDLQTRMGRMSLTSAESRQQEAFSFGPMQMQSQFDPAGNIVSSRFDGQLDKAALTAFNYRGNEVDPLSHYAESAMMPMLSFQGGSELTQNFDDITGVQASYQVGDRVSMTATHWDGSTRDQQSASYNYDANRSDVGLNFDVASNINIQTNVGVLNESQGLLGANSSGALAFGDNSLSFAGVGFDADLTQSVSAFGHFEQGFGSANGNGMISEINSIRTQEVALGLQWHGAEKAAAFTIRQPMRLESGIAQLNVPVARTLDGQVITESREANLSPSGRQIDFEIGYGFKPSTNSQMQLNLLHTLDPGHDGSAPSDTAFMTNYTYQW